MYWTRIRLYSSTTEQKLDIIQLRHYQSQFSLSSQYIFLMRTVQGGAWHLKLICYEYFN